MYCTVDLQAHDNQNLYVGRWVAVAYDIGFFVGKVTMIDTVERITINFLTKCKDSFKWPKRKDTATVNAKYIYYSCPHIQQVGKTFVLHNEDYVQTLYESYKKKIHVIEFYQFLAESDFHCVLKVIHVYFGFLLLHLMIDFK